MRKERETLEIKKSERNTQRETRNEKDRIKMGERKTEMILEIGRW